MNQESMTKQGFLKMKINKLTAHKYAVVCPRIFGQDVNQCIYYHVGISAACVYNNMHFYFVSMICCLDHVCIYFCLFVFYLC